MCAGFAILNEEDVIPNVKSDIQEETPFFSFFFPTTGSAKAVEQTSARAAGNALPECRKTSQKRSLAGHN